MKAIIIVYTILYLMLTMLAAVYSHFKTKKMSFYAFMAVFFCCAGIALTLFFYSQTYQPIQIVGFAMEFTAISSLFLYNGTKEGSSFGQVLLFSIGRFIIHLQLILFLYLFR